MKKIIAVFLAAMMLAGTVFFTGCSSSMDEETSSNLKSDVYNIYEELKPIYQKAADVYDIRDYLCKWAKNNDYACSRLAGGNLIITKYASKHQKDSPYTAFQCTISKDDYKYCCQSAAIAMSAMKNASKHGKVSIIFTAKVNDDLIGAEMLPKGYLDADYFINLDYSADTALYTGSAATADYVMSSSYSKTTTNSAKAYKITISGLTGGDSSDTSESHPNPIVTIADLLISCKSGGMVMNLSSFNGGESDGTFPKKATAVVVIDENDSDSFANSLEKSKSSFEDKYFQSNPNLKYEYEEVDTPKKVISSDDTANILSLMYTTKNGVYMTSESDGNGDTTALACKSMISTDNGRFSLNICARCTTAAIMKKMTHAYKESAGLSDMKFSVEKSTDAWPYSDSGTLIDSFRTACQQGGLSSLDPEITFKKNECAVFYEKNKDLQMLSFGVNNSDAFEQAKTLVYFLSLICNAQNSQ